MPKLRTRAAEAETLRRLPDESIQDMRDAGLFRLMLPLRVGGYQASLHQFIDVVAEVARGCGSTGWLACSRKKPRTTFSWSNQTPLFQRSLGPVAKPPR